MLNLDCIFFENISSFPLKTTSSSVILSRRTKNCWIIANFRGSKLCLSILIWTSYILQLHIWGNILLLYITFVKLHLKISEKYSYFSRSMKFAKLLFWLSAYEDIHYPNKCRRENLFFFCIWMQSFTCIMFRKPVMHLNSYTCSIVID